MASLRTASPALRSYFKENYIPQVFEVLESRGGRVRRGRSWRRFPRGWARVWRGEGVEGKRSRVGENEVIFGQVGGLG